jgi:methionyl-tRNA formyltransferase
MERGTIHPRPQDPSQASSAPIIRKEDGHIDWTLSARAIGNRVRGFAPWPGTFALLDGRGLKVIEAAAQEGPPPAVPGSVVESSPHFAVACGEGVLYLLEVQLEGKRRMSAADFLRGHPVPIGTILR